jgi:branched-chain amino acid aminotransferase
MEYFNCNGKIHPSGTSVIGPDNRGLRFGDGLFETIRSRNNRLEFADEHFARLWKGMTVLQFKIPVHFAPEDLQEQIQDILNKNRHNNMARVRLTIFRSDGGLFDEINNTPNYLIQTWALPEYTGQWNSNGLQLGIYKDAQKNCDMLSNLKHNNFLPYALAALHARKQKWNDAVLLNNHGRICDTTIANIFLIKDGAILTPSLEEGCIGGIIRKNLLNQLLRDDRKVIESEISVDDLLDADEVFLTNSIHHIRWVGEFGDKKYGHELTQKIYASFLSTIS